MGAHATLLFTGASGLVGATIYRCAASPELAAFQKWRIVLAVHRRAAPGPLRRGDRVVKADLLEAGASERLFDASEPAAVLHAAGVASLAACEAQPQLAQRAIVDVSAALARCAAAAGAHFILLSTDQVFDGASGGYREGDEPRPLAAYGRMKLAAERAVLESGADALIVRCALVLAPSPDGRSGGLDMVRGATGEVRLFEDEWRTPVSAIDLARVIDEALRRRATGVLHVAGAERVNRFELGQRIAAAFPPRAGSAAPRLVAARQSETGHARPRDVSLATERLEREAWPRPAPLPEALAELRALIATTSTA
jgi:dTDP-4-dehydrorhamnose reductase